MTQIFDETGKVVPVTVLKVGPCKIVRCKTQDRDGYEAIQLDFEDKVKREFRVKGVQPYTVGQVLTVECFRTSDLIHVTGVSKGRGFQGVIKRHGKAGGPASHGSRFHRTTGSIGQRTWPGEVFKNMKLPGHLGDDRVTVKNLQVVGIRKDDHLLLVRGAVPGAKNGVLLIRSEAADFSERLAKPEASEAK
jgi:large subunit ribosomal protein L3